MNKYFTLPFIATSILFYSCGKTPKNNNNQTGPTGPVTSGSTTTYSNGYVVKSIGFSRIVLGVDANDKLIAAELYGGGNKIVLQPGSGNNVEMIGNGSYSVLPDGFQPDGSAQSINAPIDNGTMPKDTTGVQGLCIKITGFDRQKTGYNQLNLVMDNIVMAEPLGTAGFFDNIAYTTYNTSRQNSDYTGAFFKSLFTGSINVADVEIAPPASANPYITDDEVMYEGQAVYSYQNASSYRLWLLSSTFNVDFEQTAPANFSFGGNLKYEWVNANSGSVTSTDNYDFTLNFTNIMSYEQPVLPSDTTNKVFLRITGFNPAVTGFNQLRIFVAKRPPVFDGGLPFITHEAQATAPTLTMAKQAFIPQVLFCNYAAPLVPHY